MSAGEMNGVLHELKGLKRMQEELQAEIAALEDAVKAHMDAAGLDVLTTNEFKVTYRAVTSSRVDTTSLRRELPELAERYTKQTTYKRFVLV